LYSNGLSLSHFLSVFLLITYESVTEWIDREKLASRLLFKLFSFLFKRYFFLVCPFFVYLTIFLYDIFVLSFVLSFRLFLFLCTCISNCFSLSYLSFVFKRSFSLFLSVFLLITYESVTEWIDGEKLASRLLLFVFKFLFKRYFFLVCPFFVSLTIFLSVPFVFSFVRSFRLFLFLCISNCLCLSFSIFFPLPSYLTCRYLWTFARNTNTIIITSQKQFSISKLILKLFFFDCSSKATINRLIPVGVECFLTQLLETGYFHADPHPGNLLVSCGVWNHKTLSHFWSCLNRLMWSLWRRVKVIILTEL
jgi:hypothetical protein